MKIIVLCTGNSCRSQMAEAFLKMYDKNLIVYSAGVEAHGLNPYMMKVMSEIGFDMKGHNSDTMEKYLDYDFDIVLTVCDNAEKKCPFLKGKHKHIHNSFLDPANSKGDDESKLKVYREVRDQISCFVKSFVKKIK